MAWADIKRRGLSELTSPAARLKLAAVFATLDAEFEDLLKVESHVRSAQTIATQSRRPLDHKKFLDMLVDDVEEKLIELIEGTRAHAANVDNYVGRIATALESDFNTQFYYPAFKYVRETSQYWDVQVGQVETTSILANNRSFAKVSPQATMEFDLPKRDILINEAFSSALAAYNDYGALLNDPQFLALTKMYGGQPASQTCGGGLPAPMVRDVLPGLPSQTDAQYLSQAENNVPPIGANLEALIPDPAVYKFETGTGYEIRTVIQPDGQAVVFHLNYMYSTNIREPVRADEKHLGRIKRHFIDTDVQLANYELREVSRYTLALKASRMFGANLGKGQKSGPVRNAIANLDIALSKVGKAAAVPVINVVSATPIGSLFNDPTEKIATERRDCEVQQAEARLGSLQQSIPTLR